MLKFNKDATFEAALKNGQWKVKYYIKRYGRTSGEQVLKTDDGKQVIKIFGNLFGINIRDLDEAE